MYSIIKQYEQRLQELTETFLQLLNNIEHSKLFLSSEDHSNFRIEYLGHIIKETLISQQEKTIQKLLTKVGELMKSESNNLETCIAQGEMEVLGNCAKNKFVHKNFERKEKTNVQESVMIKGNKEEREDKYTRNGGFDKTLNKLGKSTFDTNVNSLEYEEDWSQESFESNPQQKYSENLLDFEFKYLKLKL